MQSHLTLPQTRIDIHFLSSSSSMFLILCTSSSHSLSFRLLLLILLHIIIYFAIMNFTYCLILIALYYAKIDSEFGGIVGHCIRSQWMVLCISTNGKSPRLSIQITKRANWIQREKPQEIWLTQFYASQFNFVVWIQRRKLYFKLNLAPKTLRSWTRWRKRERMLSDVLCLCLL